MEAVSIQVPASLYSALFQRYGDVTTHTIVTHLQSLVSEGNTGRPAVLNDAPTKYPRPREGTITGRVWQIADQIQQQAGRADRESVIKACIAEDININTASTQFSYWRRAHP